MTEAPTTTAPPLPVPEAPPEARGDPGPQVGTIDIPKIGLSLPLFSGVNLATLDEGGPACGPAPRCPASSGNAVVAAHRVSHGGPFRKIDKLVPGDEVHFTVNGVTTSYVMVANEVVRARGHPHHRADAGLHGDALRLPSTGLHEVPLRREAEARRHVTC